MPANFVNFNTERNKAGASFDEIERRRTLAKQLGSMQPVNSIQSNEQGIAHVFGKTAEAYQNYKASQSEQARNAALAQALGGLSPEGVPPELWQTMVSQNPGQMAGVAIQSAQAQAQAQREAEAKALGRQQEQDWWRQQQEYKRANPMPTGDMIEFNAAQQNPDFGDYQTSQRKAGATNVTVGGGKYGTIPQGYELREGPQGAQLVPIPGGPADVELQASQAADANRQKGAEDRSGLVASEIDRALGVMNSGMLPDTGVGAFLADVPGTDAKALSSLLGTIKANIGFDELNKMRAQSKTGGALGQVTERELAFLQSVAGSLDQAQSADMLRYNLNRLWNGYMDVIHGPDGGPPRRPLEPSGDAAQLSDAELEAIANGQ